MKKGSRGRTANAKTGQATVELTVALVLTLIFLLASVKVFIWLNERIVRRQVDYENSRVAAGDTTPGPADVSSKDNVSEQALRLTGEVVVDESSYPKLNVFEKSN